MLITRRRLLHTSLSGAALIAAPTIVRARSVFQVGRGSPFSFPTGRLPGINWAHPATVNLRQSALVVSGTGFTNLRGGRYTLGRPPQSQASSTRSWVLPCRCLGAASRRSRPTTASKFPITNKRSPRFTSNSSGSAQMAMATGTTNAQGYTMFFGSGTSGGVHITQITTPLTSTYHLVPGVPHFVGASVGPAGQNIVIVNLATGQTYSYTSTNSGTSNTPGEVGSGYMGSQSTQFCINGKMAAGMMSGMHTSRSSRWSSGRRIRGRSGIRQRAGSKCWWGWSRNNTEAPTTCC